MGTNGITAMQAIEATQGSRGFVTTIAKRLGVSRTYVYKLQDKYPTVRQAIIDEREAMKDFAETKLFQQIDGGNIAAIIFYLKTQAKDRGYIERQEMQVDGDLKLRRWVSDLRKVTKNANGAPARNGGMEHVV